MNYQQGLAPQLSPAQQQASQFGPQPIPQPRTHHIKGQTANIAAWILSGCLEAGMVEEAMKEKGHNAKEIEATKAEMQEIITTLLVSAQLHKRSQKP